MYSPPEFWAVALKVTGAPRQTVVALAVAWLRTCRGFRVRGGNVLTTLFSDLYCTTKAWLTTLEPTADGDAVLGEVDGLADHTDFAGQRVLLRRQGDEDRRVGKN
jgi:hypothetical protein